MTTIEVEKAKIKVGISVAISILVSAGIIGYNLGGWNSFRKDTEEVNKDYKAWKPTVDSKLQNLTVIKNQNAK